MLVPVGKVGPWVVFDGLGTVVALEGVVIPSSLSSLSSLSSPSSPSSLSSLVVVDP